MHRFRRALIILLPVFHLLLALPASASPPEFDRATRLASAGDYEGALREYTGLISRAPTDRLAPVAALAAANLEVRALHDSAAALGWYERILTDYRATPWAPEAARAKAECLASRKGWTDAGEAFLLARDLARQQEKRPADAWMNQVNLSAADCFFQAGNHERVIATYQSALEGGPPPDVAAQALYRLGATYESQGDEKNAAESYSRLMQSYPSSTQLPEVVAKRPLIEPHVQIDWKPYEAYVDGSKKVAQQDLEGALRSADEVLAGTANPALRACAEYRKITCETWISGDLVRGCERMRGYIDEHPDGLRTPMAHRTLDEQWIPIAELQEDVRAHPDSVGALRALGETLVQVRLGRVAIEPLERAVALDPEDADSHLNLGYAYAMANRQEDARRAYAFYLDRNPNDTTVLNMIGYSYLGAGQAEEAIPYFKRYAALAPDDPNAHDSLGEGYMSAGKLEDAALEYEKAVALDATFANSSYMLGRIYRQLGRNEACVQAFRHYLELSPSGPQAEEARRALDELKKP